ncbi:MAG: ABC transporter permease, partial [Firmicutes bacterium]|nr:ABC transporter permease [Bacillota bacterium]
MMRNPIFESSMTRRMRSCRAPLLITLYVLFVLLVSAREIIVMQSREVTLGDLRVGLESYIYLSVMQFFLIILVAPALTAGAIAGERERQTLDLLLCTRVGAIRIVTG